MSSRTRRLLDLRLLVLRWVAAEVVEKLPGRNFLLGCAPGLPAGFLGPLLGRVGLAAQALRVFLFGVGSGARIHDNGRYVKPEAGSQ